MNSFLQDLRFALRQLRRSPGFAMIVVLALALGIGAASAIFSVVDTILLRPLPFAHQERLVSPFMKSRSGGSMPSSYLSYLDERSQLRTFQALAGYSTFGRINLEGPTGPISLRAVKTTDNFFDVFGVPPLLGRTFRPGEDHPGNDNVVVLSYEVWKSSFNGRSDVTGSTVRLDGTPYTIVGVMSAGFRFPLYEKEAIYTPLHARDSWLKSRGMHWMRTVGLLKPGVTLQQAQADISTVMTDLGRAYPEQEAGHTVSLYPLAAEVNGFGSDGKMKGPLRVLTLAVLALLEIACVNIAGLLMARGVKREREMALRTAVGANRRRLIQQLLNEGLVLSIAGLVGGVLMGWILLKAMNVFLLEAIARGSDVHLSLTVVAVSLGLSLLITLAASLLPSLRLSGTDPGRAFHTGSSGSGIARSQHRLRSTFVVAQIALSLVLPVTSGLLLKNLQRLFKTDIGVDTKKLLVVPIDLSQGRYDKRDPLPAFHQPLLEGTMHIPGVQAAGLIDMIPIAEWGNGYDIHVTGQPPYPKDIPEAAETRFVSEGYFAAMGLKLIQGRLHSPSIDRPENPAGTLGWTLTIALEKVLASVVELKAAENSGLFVVLTLTLGLIGVAASLLPARRAATIDPMQALRAD